MSIYSDKLTHVQVIINCLYSIAQFCTGWDTLVEQKRIQLVVETRRWSYCVLKSSKLIFNYFHFQKLWLRFNPTSRPVFRPPCSCQCSTPPAAAWSPNFGQTQQKISAPNSRMTQRDSVKDGNTKKNLKGILKCLQQSELVQRAEMRAPKWPLTRGLKKGGDLITGLVPHDCIGFTR